jgi:hypothetical protein
MILILDLAAQQRLRSQPQGRTSVVGEVRSENHSRSSVQLSHTRSRAYWLASPCAPRRVSAGPIERSGLAFRVRTTSLPCLEESNSIKLSQL